MAPTVVPFVTLGGPQPRTEDDEQSANGTCLTDAGDAERLTVRNQVEGVARIERRPESFAGDAAGAAELAREDLRGIVDIVRDRLRLDEHPLLVHQAPS